VVRASPDGSRVASAHEHRLHVRDVQSGSLLALFSCIDAVDDVQWSCDSGYVLCALYTRGYVQAWSLADASWHCKIDEGALGLSHARWAPDGRHILATSDFCLRLTIWSLLDRAVHFVRYPKYKDAAVDFAPDGRLMAIAHRRDGRDSVTVLGCEAWEAKAAFAVDTHDLVDLRWAPSQPAAFAVLDSPLQYKVLFYSAEGECLRTYAPIESGALHGCALGAKLLSWSRTHAQLAIGSYDERARVLGGNRWQEIADLDHPQQLRASFSPDAVAYVEQPPHGDLVTVSNGRSNGISAVEELPRRNSSPRSYVAQMLPLSVPALKPNMDISAPKLGVGLAEWSRDGRYLATRNDNMPRVLWIWDSNCFALHSVLVQHGMVRAAAWHPSRPLLAVCTGNAAVYFWTPQGCRVAPLPDGRNLHLSALQWTSVGDVLVLIDREHFCLCYAELHAETEVARGLLRGGISAAPGEAVADDPTGN